MKSKDEKEIIQYVLNNFLSKKGHRKTPERYKILDEIYSIEGHFNIDNLYKKINTKENKISLATLYNNIELFIDAGLVRKHQFGENQSKYEKSYFDKQHDHIIFTDTKEIKEFCDPRIQQIKKSVEDIFNINIYKHALYFYGTKKEK